MSMCYFLYRTIFTVPVKNEHIHEDAIVRRYLLNQIRFFGEQLWMVILILKKHHYG